MNVTEQSFCWQVLLVGLSISEAPSISIPEPVINKHGKLKKSVTQPDFLVQNDDCVGCSHGEVFVEVTKGGVSVPSKLAQLRVVEAAGVDNYVQLSGNDVQRLIATPEFNKLHVLKEMLQFF